MAALNWVQLPDDFTAKHLNQQMQELMLSLRKLEPEETVFQDVRYIVIPKPSTPRLRVVQLYLLDENGNYRLQDDLIQEVTQTTDEIRITLTVKRTGKVVVA